MADREKVVIMKRRFHVNVLPEIADAISKSNKVSCK